MFNRLGHWFLTNRGYIDSEKFDEELEIQKCLEKIPRFDKRTGIKYEWYYNIIEESFAPFNELTGEPAFKKKFIRFADLNSKLLTSLKYSTYYDRHTTTYWTPKRKLYTVELYLSDIQSIKKNWIKVPEEKLQWKSSSIF